MAFRNIFRAAYPALAVGGVSGLGFYSTTRSPSRLDGKPDNKAPEVHVVGEGNEEVENEMAWRRTVKSDHPCTQQGKYVKGKLLLRSRRRMVIRVYPLYASG